MTHAKKNVGSEDIKHFFNLFSFDRSFFAFAVKNDPFLERIRSLFLQIYSVFAAISYVFIAFEAKADSQPALSWTFFCFAFVLVCNLFFYRLSHRLRISSNLLLVVIFLVILVGSIYHAPLLGGLLWFMPFPLYVFFLKNLKQALYWIPSSLVLIFVIPKVIGHEILLTESLVGYVFVGILISLSVLLILFFIDRRQAELVKYELIARYAKDLILFVDSAGTILYSSPSLTSYFDYSPEDMEGQKIQNFLTKNSIQKIEKAFMQKSGRLFLDAYNPKTTKKYALEGSFQLIATPQDIRIYLIVGRDMTSQLAAEAELRVRVQESERMNKLMVGRELTMVELKKEIQRLKNKG